LSLKRLAEKFSERAR